MTRNKYNLYIVLCKNTCFLFLRMSSLNNTTNEEESYLNSPFTILPIYCFIYYCIIAFYPCYKSEIFQSSTIDVFIPFIYNNTIITQWNLICHAIISLKIKYYQQKKTSNKYSLISCLCPWKTLIYLQTGSISLSNIVVLILL